MWSGGLLGLVTDRGLTAFSVVWNAGFRIMCLCVVYPLIKEMIISCYRTFHTFLSLKSSKYDLFQSSSF